MRITHELFADIPGLGERIKNAREASGKTTTALARAAGMSRGNWYRIESEELKSIPLDTLKRIEEALEIDLGSNQIFEAKQ
ncbi:helix-turn-helix transcriptional regulator [Leptolyngbya boryana CZ1]|uniref:Helix-turn-helix transcriptional regulator n=1 Tax=Leptolyngbya boryana CZ1 TaxID=3060204 RepID=A0AA96WTK5_LEPBY|nr:helix-turn-helix transcriptional regulator [Leptolyngbya boryana]WNZ45178.1 helix-turn-helix transcriptional regulator [Leptolyngbya boryana CZ1]